PIWNDDKTAPYTFTDYPTAHKTVFYHFGIEEVAQTDHYAALLCSRHYVRFLRKNMSLAAQTFIQRQEEWSKRIIGTLSDFNRDNYDYHYGILQMLDDISLFMCLNEPGTTGDDLHPFFKNGINKHEAITAIPDESLDIYWNDARAICLDPFPFVDTFKVHLKRRTIMKTMIEQKGLIDSYWNAPLETIDINVTPV
ncbi:MAG TPA: DUF3891 family protein, partial [Bacillota bacterium]|nr:DUF3891 family protein [Bacillota bacterium]